MTLFPQMLLDVHDELIVDLFAGGGGASLGIEMATGRQVDVAVDHDAAAVALHEANHPQTRHFHSDVFEVDPRDVTGGRPVGLLWASPDCTYHSKARGAKPIRHRDRKRRALAWVVTRWAGQVRPRVIMLENVEEFSQWGPLVAKRKRGRTVKASGGVAAPGERVPVWDQKLVPRPDGASRRFRSWVRSLEDLGYRVEWRELRAADYGAPTIRKRLYLIARCDGEPIVWPEPTHGPGRAHPYHTAAECIDWSVPMLSIFATPAEAKDWARAWRDAGVSMGTPRRPLADATLRRVARGVVKYVLEAGKPFLVSVAHGYSGGRREYPLEDPIGTVTGRGVQHAVTAPYLVPIQNYGWGDRPADLADPMRTVTAHPKGGAFALAAPYLVPRYGERKGQEPRTRSIQKPGPVVVPSANGGSLVAAFLAKHYGGVVGTELDRPAGTVTTVDHHSLVTATLEGTHDLVHEGSSRTGREGIAGGEDRRDSLEAGYSGQPSERHRDRASQGGKPDGCRLSRGEGRVGWEASTGVRASSGVDGPARSDPRGDADQPHRRRQDEQPPREPRDRDASAEHPSLDTDRPRPSAWVQPRAAGGVEAASGAASRGGDDLPGDRGKTRGLADHSVPGRAGAVAAFLSAYYGQGTGQELGESMRTTTTKDRMGLVTVSVEGQDYILADIAMRMLQPRELYRAQGFPDSYRIDRGADGKPLTKTEQVRMVGNSVCPPQAAALVWANLPEMCVRDEIWRWA